MKILITGGSGFIGRHLVSYLLPFHYQLIVLARHLDDSIFDKRVGLLEVDITNKEEIQSAIIFAQPNVMIHTAAMSKPNDCEVQKEQCLAANVAATKSIAEACKVVGAKLIFLSTDFVFGHNGPYDEESTCEPVNYYGYSKMLAEQAIAAVGLTFAIVRTVLVVGSTLKGQSNTFLQWVNENLEADKTIYVYTDQLRNVTYVNDLCSGIKAILDTNFQGIIHIAGTDAYTPFQLAKAVAEVGGYNQSLVMPVDRYTRPEIAVRPGNATLKNRKAELLLGFTTTSLEKILAEVFPAKSKQ